MTRSLHRFVPCTWFALLSLVLTLSANAETFDSLINSPTRPTMARVEPLVADIHQHVSRPMVASEGQGWFDRRLDIHGWLPKLLQSGPKLIASFEQVYPGATWVFLGRDGLPWADLFEAYYSSLGQSDRVIRLGISKPSMKSATDPILIELLRGQGVKMDNLDKEHPYIFVDSVSQGYGRQGRRLLSAMYTYWSNQGRDPLLLLDKIDMIGLEVSTFQGVPNNIEFKPLHQYLQALYLLEREGAGRGRFPLALDQGLRIMTVPPEPGLASEAGYTHFLGAWHESFGPIVRQAGVYEAVPGALYPIPMRESILWTQAQIWSFVNSGACDRSVQSWARQLGFSFTAQRAPILYPDPNRIHHVRDKIQRRRWSFDAQDENTLPSILKNRAIGIVDRQHLINRFEMSYPELSGFDWNASAKPKTALADIKFLQRTLHSDCAVSLETPK